MHDHLSLLSSQYLARCLIPNNPSHSVVTSSSGPRHMKQTLQRRFHPLVAPFLTNGSLPADAFKETLDSLHTSAVQRTISSRPPNRVLQEPAPPVSEEELSLSRPYRTTLAQLRSSFSPVLNSYLERIGRSPDNLCPSCRGAPHTTAHLFSCPSHPTSLVVLDLWDRPCAVAELLPTLDLPYSFPQLPHSNPEPPPPGQ